MHKNNEERGKKSDVFRKNNRLRKTFLNCILKIVVIMDSVKLRDTVKIVQCILEENMKQIMEHKNYMLKRISMLLAVVVCMVLVVGTVIGTSIDTSAAEKVIQTTSDYTVKVVEESTTSCKVVFTPNSTASLVILHYVINDDTSNQQNPLLSATGNDWVYEISGVKAGDRIKLFYTYNLGQGEYGSEWVTHEVGTASESGGTTGGGSTEDDSEDNSESGSGSETVSGTKIEAESYVFMSGVTNEGAQISSLDTNDWMRYQTNVASAGKYRIVARAKASGTTDGKIVFRNESGRIGEVSVTKGGADFADYKSDEITLSAGTMQLTSIVVSGGITADYFVLEPVTSQGGGNNGGGNTGGGSTGGGSTGEYEVPEVDETIPVQNDKIIFQFNNKTNGAYADDQVYWCILGYKPVTMELCYVEADGTLVPVNAGMNTIPVGDRMCADIYNTLEDNDYVYMPSIVSGRMYLSYGSPVYITINETDTGVVGFAGPDLNNPSDPNANVLFEFLEFTIGSGLGTANENPVEYWGNTTRVDNYCFPVVTRLMGENGSTNGINYDIYDKTVGDLGTRQEMFDKYRAQAPAEWQNLVTKDKNGNDLRIIAPCKGDFNEGKPYANYFDAYIDAFWTKYTNEDLHFECQGGDFTCRVKNGVLTFTESRSGQKGTVQKPTTQEMLEGKGAFDTGTAIEKVLEAQLCAAFTRGVALQPENWYNPEAYYQGDGENKQYPYNYYSKFMHENSINGFSYGFCYDDVHEQATLLHFTNPTTLAIDLKW